MYFGEVGDNSKTLLTYFTRNGARACGDDENPAEYMLETIGVGSHNKSDIDWHQVWKDSPESQSVRTEIDHIHAEKAAEPVTESGDSSSEFAMPLYYQIQQTTFRVFQQYWRMPNYIWGKLMLGLASSLFIGFSFFLQNSSSAGLQNSIFAIFMLTATLSTLVQQVSSLPKICFENSANLSSDHAKLRPPTFLIRSP